jgi:hypothetical protein
MTDKQGTGDILAPLETFFPKLVEIALALPADRQQVVNDLIRNTGVDDSALVNRHAQELHQLLVTVGRNVGIRQREKTTDATGYSGDIIKLLQTTLDALSQCATLSDPALQALLTKICAFCNTAAKRKQLHDPLEICGNRYDPFDPFNTDNGGATGNSNNYYDPLDICGNDSLTFSNDYNWCW